MNPAQQALNTLLATALGDQRSVSGVVSSALATARRSTLPSAPGELLGFVKAYLVGPLSAELGPRIALALLHDLAIELDVEPPSDREPTFYPEPASQPRPMTGIAPSAIVMPRSVVPRSGATVVRPSVLLVDADRFGRPALARALVRGGCDCTTAENAEEVKRALGSGETFHAALVDADLADIEDIIDVLSNTDLRLVFRAKSLGTATAFLVATGLEAFDVRTKETRAEDVVALLKRPAARVVAQ
jgi:CheY-like chemotaxis protein